MATFVPLVFEGATGVWPFRAGDLTSVSAEASLLEFTATFCALRTRHTG